MRNDFPVPAGAASTSTAAPEVRTPRNAAAWSQPSSRPERANRPITSCACSCLHAGAPCRTAAASSSASPRSRVSVA
jgi:hypothetical protein